MKLKRIACYRLELDSQFLTGSSALMGLAFFLQSVHFFGLTDLLEVGVLPLLFQLMLPMLLEMAWFILLRGFYWNAPGLYGILGAVLCVMTMVQTVFFGSIMGAIVAVPTCLLAAMGILVVIAGMVRSRFVGVLAFLILLVLRFLFGGLQEPLLEAAAWSGLLAVMTLMGALKNTDE